MSIFGYARLNNQRPTPKNLGIRKQVQMIQRWAEERQLTIRAVFRDTAPSSASLDLPNLNKLITLIEEGEVSILVVARLDRLTRLIRFHKKLLDLFEEKNVRFVSILEGLDSNSKSGKKVLEALGIMALWDAKSIPDRTLRMIELKKKIGERVGHAPFGYTYHEKKLIPLQKELVIASIIREKREDEKLSYHKIAKFLNSQRMRAKRGGRWYAETIKVICENPLYERDIKT